MYAVVGTSRSAGIAPRGHPAMYMSVNSLGSMVLDVTGNRLDAYFVNSRGIVQDQFSISKKPVVPQILTLILNFLLDTDIDATLPPRSKRR